MRWTLLALLLGLVGCPDDEEAAPCLDDGTCSSWLGAQASGNVQSSVLSEVSGMAASRRSADTLWMHNDAGNSASLFALSATGESLGTWSILGVENRDWEDLAVGPCTDGSSCLYLGDIGDNDLARESVLLYRMPEPDAGLASSGQIGEKEDLWFTYPDGLAHDAEAVAVHPDTGEVVVLTKAGEDGLTGVFVFPEAPPPAAPETAPTTLTQVAWIDLMDMSAQDAQVTAADVSPLGRRVALRTDDDVLLFDVPDGGTLADALLEEPRFAPAPDEDGEAITFSTDGRSLLLVGEGVSPTVWEVRCNVFESAGSEPCD